MLYPELTTLDEQRLLQRWEQASPAGEDAFSYYCELAQILLDRVDRAEIPLSELTDFLEAQDSDRTAALLLTLHSQISHPE